MLGNVLLSQDPAVQVPSALKGLTVVFEMGTRGSLSPLSPNSEGCSFKTGYESFHHLCLRVSPYNRGPRKVFGICFLDLSSLFGGLFRISPRPISIGQLNTLLCLHLQPINLVVFKGSY